MKKSQVIASSHMSFRIFGENIDFDEITCKLGIKPTYREPNDNYTYCELEEIAKDYKGI